MVPANPRQARSKTVCYSLMARTINSILGPRWTHGIALIILRKSVPKCNFSLDMPSVILL